MLRSVSRVASRRLLSSAAATKPPVRVAVTGAAGQIGYALLFRIASGALLGPDQPVIIHAIELPHALGALKGVSMELKDCAFPLLQQVVETDDIALGFEDVDYSILVGAKPRSQGMERGDLLKENGGLFAPIGQALNKYAKKTCKTLVVGNPANTNCLIAAHHAPDIPRENFSAMMRLDHDRGLAQISEKTGAPVTDVSKFCVWGNHSATQFPDLTQTEVAGTHVPTIVGKTEFPEWYDKEFIPTIQQRGAAVINARGSSSAASAANAAIAQVRDWALGSDGKWVSMAVSSNGNSYGVPDGLFFGFPVTCDNGSFKVVDGLEFSPYSKAKFDATLNELKEERDAVAEFLS